MPDVLYIEASGREHRVDVPAGWSLMEGAVKNDVPGILADCGGSGSCATCHVHVDAAWWASLSPPSDDEIGMLEMAIDPSDTSRLSCQIMMADALAGLVLRLPRDQI